MNNLSPDTDINVSNDELFATDGTMSDMEDTTEDVETTNDETTEQDEDLEEVEKQEEQIQQKKSKGVAKLLARKNELESRVQQLENDNAIKGLQLTHGEFDIEKVLEIKNNNPTLSYDDALLLWKAKQPKTETKRTGGIIGSEARNLGKDTVTDAELQKMGDKEYSMTMDLIQTGKIRHLRG